MRCFGTIAQDSWVLPSPFGLHEVHLVKRKKTKYAVVARILCSVVCLLFATFVSHAQSVTMEKGDGRAEIYVDGHRIASYVWEDAAVPRPYFGNVVLPDGTPITRRYPPDPVADANNDDHATFHPGIWLAFGDIIGTDYWRNRARVRQISLQEQASDESKRLTFDVHNVYEREDHGKPPICEERCRYTIQLVEHRVLITATSVFSSAHGDFYFGDQEEMGFGARLATPLTVRHGQGTLRNADGGVDEAGTWGRAADWCAGYARQGDRLVGLSVLSGPDNLRPAWFHSRDYGLIVANPFGRKAMTGPKDDAVMPEKTVVKQGESLELRFGIYLFASPEEALNLPEIYDVFIASLAG